MWERTLQDLIRGLRANKSNESRFIAGAIDEIRKEVRSDDMELKAAAVLKLTYVRVPTFDFREEQGNSWNMLTARDARIQHGLGLLSCRRGYVVAPLPFEEYGIPCGDSIFRARHRCANAHDESFEKGTCLKCDLRGSESVEWFRFRI